MIASADAPLLEHVEALRHDIPTVFISAQPPEESSGGEAWDFCSVENAALSSKLVTRMQDVYKRQPPIPEPSLQGRFLTVAL